MTSRIACILSLCFMSACALFTACRSSSMKPAIEPPDPIARFAGSWFRQGARNILGAGSDQIWTIERGAIGWTLAITAVRYPSVNEQSKVVTRVDFAPTPLAWTDGRLDFIYPLQPATRTRLTVDMMGGRLMLPAVVQRDERTWEFEGWNDRESFQCEHDPRVVPNGQAILSRAGYSGRPSYYRTAVAKSGRTQGVMAPCIEFFQIAPNGDEHMCFQLVFEGEPHGTVVRLGTTFSGFAGHLWERLSDEKRREIQALPLVQPP